MSHNRVDVYDSQFKLCYDIRPELMTRNQQSTKETSHIHTVIHTDAYR